jgi:hypothetical protein
MERTPAVPSGKLIAGRILDIVAGFLLAALYWPSRQTAVMGSDDLPLPAS